MTPAPTQPNAQAPVVDVARGTLTPEMFRFVQVLLAYARALEARIATLESKVP